MNANSIHSEESLLFLDVPDQPSSVEHVQFDSDASYHSKMKKLSSVPRLTHETTNTKNLWQDFYKDKIFLHAKGRFICFGSYII